MSRILIVGAGVTGAAISHFLRVMTAGVGRDLAALPVVTIWEASQEVGGRMSTDYHGDCRCDLGAQYITKNSDDFDDIYGFLVEQKTFHPLRNNRLIEGMREEHLRGNHYVAPHGTSSIVSSLLCDTAVAPQLGVSLIYVDFDESQSKVVAARRNVMPVSSSIPISAGVSDKTTVEEFDVVILTMLAPQIAQLGLGTSAPTASSSSFLDSTIPSLPRRAAAVGDLISSSRLQERDGYDVLQSLSTPISLRERLARVRYSSRFALALYYKLTSTERKKVLESVSWRAKYVFDDEIIRYVSIENFKSEIVAENEDIQKVAEEEEEEELAVLIHTSVPFGLAHIGIMTELHQRQQQNDDVVASILESLTKESILPALKQYHRSGSTTAGSSTAAGASGLVRHRLLGWKYSQVSRGYHYVDPKAISPPNVPEDVARELQALPKEDPAVIIIPAAGMIDKNNSSTTVSVTGMTPPPTPAPTIGSSVSAQTDGAMIILAGDAYTESNFEGCLKSAQAAAAACMQHVLSSHPTTSGSS